MSAGQRTSSQWKTWRMGMAALMVVSLIAATILAMLQQRAYVFVMFASIGAASLAAAGLCWRSALSFDAGQSARQVWMLIGLMPVTDLLVQLSYSLPGLVGNRALGQWLVPTTNALSSLSHMLAALAFLMMIRVYRKSGIRLQLGPAAYAVMIVVSIVGIASVILSDRVAGLVAGNDDTLHRWMFVTSLPMRIALIPCAIFGVMIWRYAAEMGGGLVAKAWRSILLYAVLWMIRIAGAGAATYFASSSARGVLFIGVSWVLFASQYLIFLGASYQYEACTGSIEFEEDMSLMPS